MRQMISPSGETFVMVALTLLLLVFLYVLLRGDVQWIRGYLAHDPSLQWQNLKPLPG
jgi:hypothetical protein